MLISSDLLNTFSAFAQTLDLGVIAVSNTVPKTILFASKLEPILGYKDMEITGQPFEILLPEEMRSRHDALMESFCKLEGSSTSRGMANGRQVKAIHRDGQLVPITIAISYHPGANTTPDVFLALIKNPQAPETDDQFESVQAVFTSLLKPTERVIRQTKAAIAKKMAATGGILGFILWIITSITPFGTAIKGFIAAWNWQSTTGLQPDDVRVYNGINEETRILNLSEVRDALKEIDDSVLAVVFYRYSYNPTTGKGKLDYRADSGESNGDEDWFPSFTLDSQQHRALINHDCVYVSGKVELKSRPGQPTTGMIMCPTFTVGKSDFSHLSIIKNANVAAVSLEPGWVKGETADALATTLWRLATPNLDVDFSPILQDDSQP